MEERVEDYEKQKRRREALMGVDMTLQITGWGGWGGNN